MKNFGMAVVAASFFGKESLDSNGKQAIWLSPVAGVIPNKNTISGTVAERSGIDPDKCYLVSINELEESEYPEGYKSSYGRQFRFQKVAECSAVDVPKLQKELGSGSIVNVDQIEEPAKATNAKAASSVETVK